MRRGAAGLGRSQIAFLLLCTACGGRAAAPAASARATAPLVAIASSAEPTSPSPTSDAPTPAARQETLEAKPPWIPLIAALPPSTEPSLSALATALDDAVRSVDDKAVAKALREAPSGPLATLLGTLARLRVQAARQDWPTGLGAAPSDARIVRGLASLAPLPDAPLVRLERARWLLVLGRYDDAAALAEVSAPSLPDQPEAASLLGLSRLATGHLSEAQEPLERAARLDPASAARWGNLGTVRLMNGRVNEALLAFETRTRLAPSDAQARSDLGTTLLQAGELARGEDELRRAVALAPEHASYLSNLGYALSQRGKRSEAKQHYERALALDPRLLPALLNLSALLAGDPTTRSEARIWLQRAAAIAADDPRVQAARRDLDELERGPGTRR